MRPFHFTMPRAQAASGIPQCPIYLLARALKCVRNTVVNAFVSECIIHSAKRLLFLKGAPVLKGAPAAAVQGTR
jgi:hypothetical protein